MIKWLVFIVWMSPLQAQGQLAEEKLYQEFLQRAGKVLAQEFRWPNAAESEDLFAQAKDAVLKKLEGKKKKLKDGEEEPEMDPELAALWDLGVEEFMRSHPNPTTDLMRLFPDQYNLIRRKIAAAYTRAVRQTDLPPQLRVVPTTPTDNQFFVASIKAKGNGGDRLYMSHIRGKYTIENLRDLYTPGRTSKERMGYFSQPLMFPGGIQEVEQVSRADSPLTYRNYVDTRNIVTLERVEKTKAAIENAPGFIAISWTSGKKISEDFLNTLLEIAERKNIPILIGPTRQNYEGMPEIFLTHPRIHIVTHSIENDALKIWNIPLNPNIENPLTAMKKPGAYKPGQIVLGFHPHQTMEVVATAANHEAPVTVLTTGTLNDPESHFPSVSQGTTVESNEQFQTTRAWLFEKADGVNEFDKDGPQNAWHFRRLDFYDDRAQNGTAGIIDILTAYQYRYAADGSKKFETVHVDPEYIIGGDQHDPVTDQRVLKSIMEELGLDADTVVTYLTGDFLDNGNISRHMTDRNLEMNKRFQMDAMGALSSVNNGIQTMNGFLQRYPHAKFSINVGNHEEWLPKLTQKPSDLQSVINGDFLAELSFVELVLKHNLWDYLVKGRATLLGELMRAWPDKRDEILRRVVPVFDPDRVHIQNRGEALILGPAWRRLRADRHGDQTTYGRKFSTLKDQARGTPEGGSVTGHTHSPGQYLNSIDVGGNLKEIYAAYARGYFSRTGEAVALVYPNGTAQLLPWNRLVHSFRQMDPASVSAPQKFFGDSPLKIVQNDNQLVDRDAGLQPVLNEVERVRTLTQGAGCKGFLEPQPASAVAPTDVSLDLSGVFEQPSGS